MFDPKTFDEIAKKLYDSLPDGIKQVERGIQDQFKQILQSTFDKLDLVTRDEFDVQVKVLQRTREKVEALERQFKQSPKPETPTLNKSTPSENKPNKKEN